MAFLGVSTSQNGPKWVATAAAHGASASGGGRLAKIMSLGLKIQTFRTPYGGVLKWIQYPKSSQVTDNVSIEPPR